MESKDWYKYTWVRTKNGPNYNQRKMEKETDLGKIHIKISLPSLSFSCLQGKYKHINKVVALLVKCNAPPKCFLRIFRCIKGIIAFCMYFKVFILLPKVPPRPHGFVHFWKGHMSAYTSYIGPLLLCPLPEGGPHTTHAC